MNLETHLTTEPENRAGQARLRDKMGHAVRDLHPGYGALVMATGIVSLGAGSFDLHSIAWLLARLGEAAYLVLVAALAARLWFFPASAHSDFHDRLRGPGFFTLVAATCILGTQLLTTGDLFAAWLLWLVGAGLWLVLTYAFFAAMIGEELKPPLRAALDGGWLVAVVASQSVSILGTLLAAKRPASRDALLFIALLVYLLADVLYLLIMALLLQRLLVQPLTPAEFTPPYWISMGAAAITTLAGSTLMLHAPAGSVLASLHQFLTGLTLLFWATATWWIPLLVILEIRLHLRERSRPRYDPAQWDIVFPLGMYAVATEALARATALPFLSGIAHAAFYPALSAWTIVGAGGLYSLRSWLTSDTLARTRVDV